eukprot:gnl/Dysnectes_brevis/5603_a8144_458.p1 GENE.gnl/Dysnectes_brevis/5603_a8144_458~~gnl/Dysnectes_brevis/5603_a8144_458.p1  ORF type:complete len:638 (+),score=80.03 gnl/Dysnectes_brevis/5603_a8144_458:35-1915(+)
MVSLSHMLIHFLCSSLLLSFLMFFFDIGSLFLSYQQHPVSTASLDSQHKPHTACKRMIFILVDGMRNDAINHFNFNDSIINSFQTTISASIPTLTAPCLRTMMSGRIPGMFDAVTAFTARQIHEDSVIHQAHLVEDFYTAVLGDNTWDHLWPDSFTYSSTRYSFDIKDLDSVDDLIEKELQYALNKLEEANRGLLILHFLGLDHISHLLGPHTPLAHNRLDRYASVTKRIADDILLQDTEGSTCLMLTSDHGMTTSGSHGGGSQGELLVPLLLLGPGTRGAHTVTGGAYSQRDIAPTLSLLLGLPVPQHSLGTPLPLPLPLPLPIPRAREPPPEPAARAVPCAVVLGLAAGVVLIGIGASIRDKSIHVTGLWLLPIAWFSNSIVEREADILRAVLALSVPLDLLRGRLPRALPYLLQGGTDALTRGLLNAVTVGLAGASTRHNPWRTLLLLVIFSSDLVTVYPYALALIPHLIIPWAASQHSITPKDVLAADMITSMPNLFGRILFYHTHHATTLGSIRLARAAQAKGMIEMACVVAGDTVGSMAASDPLLGLWSAWWACLIAFVMRNHPFGPSVFTQKAMFEVAFLIGQYVLKHVISAVKTILTVMTRNHVFRKMVVISHQSWFR